MKQALIPGLHNSGHNYQNPLQPSLSAVPGKLGEQRHVWPVDQGRPRLVEEKGEIDNIQRWTTIAES